MIRTMRLLLALAAIAEMVGLAGQAEASSITYTETTLGTGSLGGTSFVDVAVTLVATADTSNVFQFAPGVYGVYDSSLTVSVGGIGTATFTNNPSTPATYSVPLVPFAGQTVVNNGDILICYSTAFSTYDLTTSIGPITGTSGVSGNPNQTTLGDFILASAGDVTFTAVTAAVPEPSAIILAGTGILVGFGARTRRRTNATPLRPKS